MGSKSGRGFEWQALCGSCKYFMSPKGKVAAICRDGRFREADLSSLTCQHREEKEEVLLPRREEEQEAAVAVPRLGGAGEGS